MKRLLFIAGILPTFLLMLSIQTSRAGSATWKTSPNSDNWNRAANWTPQTIPNGPSDTASFAASDTTNVSLSASTEVNGIVFNAGASAFTITTSPGLQLNLSGVGITNNSGIMQNFVAVGAESSSGVISFENGATAGSGTVFTNTGIIGFSDSSTAGNGTFTNMGGSGNMVFLETSNADHGTFINEGNGFPIDINVNSGGDIRFIGGASAGHATFTNNGGPASGEIGGQILFLNNSSGNHGTFINNGGQVSGAGGGLLVFSNQSTAAHATLIANGGSNGGAGGTIKFTVGGRGATARVAVYANGNLDLSVPDGINEMPVSIGSIEGTGQVFLGGKSFGGHTLTVGTNDLSTTFSGMIQDGGQYGGTTGGHLTKVGMGTLTLAKRNTYTGGTTINSGTLLVNNKHFSGTGSGGVQLTAGTLGGTGKIAGIVQVGGGAPGAFLSPGKGGSSLGTLTVRSILLFDPGATYKFNLNSNTAKSDSIIANGVILNSGAQFTFTDVADGTLPIGNVFTVIDNTSANPIAGIFVNLPEGSTFTSNGNSYQVSYEGGDGNDLTLTVVP